MKEYTYQIGKGAGSSITNISFSEILHAGSLTEAIDKAKAITNTRDRHKNEDTARLLDQAAELEIVWFRPIEAVRNA